MAVCVSVCLSLAAFPHCCTDPDVSWGMVGCPLIVHYWADLQSVHGFRRYDKIAPNAKYQLYTWLMLLYCNESRNTENAVFQRKQHQMYHSFSEMDQGHHVPYIYLLLTLQLTYFR